MSLGHGDSCPQDPVTVQPYLADLGSKRHVALVAEIDGKVVGIGEYLTIAPGDCAEVAFALADAYQGLGLGTALLEHLATLARSNGIHRFVGSTLADNRRMMSVFADSGFDMKMVTRTGVVEVALDLDIEGGDVERDRARRRAADGARSSPCLRGDEWRSGSTRARRCSRDWSSACRRSFRGERIPLFSIAALVAILIDVVVVVPWTRRWGTVRRRVDRRVCQVTRSCLDPDYA